MELVFVVIENSLDHHVELFLRTKRAAKRPRTVQWYKNVLRDFRQVIAHLQPDWPPSVEHCLAYLETFEVRGLAESSRDNYYRALRAFLNWLRKCGYIQESPLAYIDGPGAPRRLPKAPPRAKMARLFGVVRQAAGEKWENTRDLALFCLALDTGARIGELEAIRLADLDPAGREIRIYGAKTSEDRVVKLGDVARAELERWLKVRAGLSLPRPLKRGGALFVGRRRRREFGPLTASGMRQRLKVWQKRAGIEPFNFHAFRHACAIYSLWNRAPLIDVRDQLGHKSIKTTAIYTEVVDEGRLERHRQTSALSNLQDFDTGPILW